jgi:hypothetical protein
LTARDQADSWARVRTGVLVAVILGLPLAVLVPRIAPIVGTLALAVVLVVSFGELARIDRPAYVSVATPVVVVALAGLLLPWRLALVLDDSAAIFLGLFAFAGGSFVPWWWRVILHRPKVAFGIWLKAQIDVGDRLVTDALFGSRDRRRHISRLDEHIARLRARPAPDAEWTAIRDDYADEFHTMLELGWRSASAAEYQAEVEHAKELRRRFEDFMARGG